MISAESYVRLRAMRFITIAVAARIDQDQSIIALQAVNTTAFVAIVSIAGARAAAVPEVVPRLLFGSGTPLCDCEHEASAPFLSAAR